MIRKRKLYVKPKKLYQKERIKEENALMQEYALKSKREIWKTLAKVNYYRTRAKILAKYPLEDQKVLFEKLNRIGLKVKNTADVLALKIEDLLKRRLTTVITKKGLAKTPQQARQLVVHKKILIANKVINAPSYLVPLDQEELITVKQPVQRKVQEETKAEQVEQAGESQ